MKDRREILTRLPTQVTLKPSCAGRWRAMSRSHCGSQPRYLDATAGVIVGVSIRLSSSRYIATSLSQMTPNTCKTPIVAQTSTTTKPSRSSKKSRSFRFPSPSIFLFPLSFIEFVDAALQRCCQGGQLGCGRIALATLPLANSLIADTQTRCKVALRQSCRNTSFLQAFRIYPSFLFLLPQVVFYIYHSF